MLFKKRSDYQFLFFSCLIGIFFSLRYWGLPPIRNSVIAIKTSLALNSAVFSIENFVATTKFTYGKPIGFPIILFFVNKFFLFPNSVYLTSLILGGLFCFSFWCLFKAYEDELGENKKFFLFLVLFNPWVFTHFYSLSPDTAYLILVNFFLVGFKKYQDKQSVLLGISIFALICLAMTIRLHALILVFVWLILNKEKIALRKSYRAEFFGLGILVLFLMISLLGKNPLMNLTSNADGGRDDYFTYVFSIMSFKDYLNNFIQLIFFLLTIYPFIWIEIKYKNSFLANKGLVLSVMVILISLLLYKWTYHNTRYFFILIPFLSLIFLNKVNSFSPIVMISTLTVNLLGNYIININPDAIYFLRGAKEFENTTFDNIRVYRRIKDMENITLFKNSDCQKLKCVIVNGYYKDAYFNLYELMNYWSADKQVTYFSDINFKLEDENSKMLLWYKNLDTSDITPFIRKRFPNSKFKVEKIADEVFNIEAKK